MLSNTVHKGANVRVNGMGYRDTDACDCSDCENGIAESIPHEDDEYSDEDEHEMAE